MSAAARNYELVTLELHEHYSELDPFLQKQFEELLNCVRTDLTNGKSVSDSADDLIESVFSIRIKALKWLAKQKTLNIEDTLNEAEKLNLSLSNEKRFELLSENMGFAIRTLRRVTKAIIQKLPSKKELQDGIKSFPDMDYRAYFDTLSITVPNEELVEKLMEWTDSSLALEYAILSALLIQDEDLNVSSTTINELAELIASAAQNYSASSVELGIMPMHTTKSSQVYYTVPDEDFIKEQQLLADSGLEDMEGI